MPRPPSPREPLAAKPKHLVLETRQRRATTDFVNQYTVDALGQTTRITQSGIAGGNSVTDKRVDFGYNVAGEQTNIDRYVNPAEDLVAASDSIFDELGRLTHLTYQDGDTTTLAEYDWAIDDAGRITQMKSKADAASGYDWGVTGYTYDNGGQLTGAAYSDFANAPADESYGLDANGNRTSGNFTVVDPDGNNRMATGAGYSYSYDAEGNRTLRFASTSGALDSTATDITRYIWDHRDRLTEVRHYATYTAYQSDTSDQVVEYAYDYQNRWVRKVVNPGTDAQEKTIFVYDGMQIAMQFDGTADATDPPLAASALSHRYLWGPKVDQILADEKLTGPTPEVLWTLTDHLNTVRDIVEYTGGVTSVTQHLVYNSFGTETSAIASSCLFGFTARPFDQDTGLQNNLNRWYEATTGKWLSEDPIGFAARDPSLTRYCANMPVCAVDPLGSVSINGTSVESPEPFEGEKYTYGWTTTHWTMYGTVRIKELSTTKTLFQKTYCNSDCIVRTRKHISERVRYKEGLENISPLADYGQSGLLKQWFYDQIRTKYPQAAMIVIPDFPFGHRAETKKFQAEEGVKSIELDVAPLTCLTVQVVQQVDIDVLEGEAHLFKSTKTGLTGSWSSVEYVSTTQQRASWAYYLGPETKGWTTGCDGKPLIVA